LGELNTLFPGVRDHLTFLESATPPTLERYTLNRQGATYGWSNTPTQAGTQRPGHLTPISGLLLSGHWTQPGSGSLRAMYSGLQTAMIAQGATDFEQFLGALGAA
jgi:prolycopene isomerase